MRTLLFLLAILLCSAIVACENCSDVGCGPAIAVAVYNLEQEPFPEGSYRFVLRADDEAPLEMDCELAGSALTCEQDPWPFSAIYDTDGAPTVLLLAYVIPETYTFRIHFEDALVAEQSFQAQYETYYPNGNDCAPVCRLSSDQMEVELP